MEAVFGSNETAIDSENIRDKMAEESQLEHVQ